MSETLKYVKNKRPIHSRCQRFVDRRTTDLQLPGNLHRTDTLIVQGEDIGLIQKILC
ncbi:hypothetical protein CFBP6109_P200069 (plasmid) [Pseudomonas syringae pv. cerasicola]|uniref:Uncharacterized protein n=1 Tax=Pseudomonas syringae pv. cerasicola TaxID=264451 RepID=A0A330JVU0_PSESX|nr:hypothetical protein CFBP6109_P200069 [Pseudomonas syringae pv. cerasicola]SPD89424.1 hypothetical protein PSCFBP6110_P200006 [Pseudomonas syringae pv. cerasicola]